MQNPVDFKLSENKTLSVKTNQNSPSKVAPQNIGQPTAETYFKYIENHKIIPSFNLQKTLKSRGLEDNYINRSILFKELSLQNIDLLISMYWKNIFECDYLLYLFNLKKKSNPLDNYMVFKKSQTCPFADISLFSFTQTLQTWNESNTVKYKNISIGEFQVHTHRNCFKFRFNMKGIINLLNKNTKV